MKRLATIAPWIAFAITVLAAILVPHLRLSGDLARLFPDDREARALGDYVRAFGGGDVTTILVRGEDPAAVEGAANEIALAIDGAPGVVHATTTLAPTIDPDAPLPDPTLAWAFADDEARASLDGALSDEGMKARLEETRALLLAPGGGAASTYLANDPLRLLALVRSRARSVAATIGADESGALVADGGRARFVLVTTKGSALKGDEAKAMVAALDAAIAKVLPAHPGVRAAVAGGAAIARDVEAMIKRDLVLSSVLSTVLVAVAFLATFRRARALAAIFPPLLLGTLWTTAIAAIVPGGVTGVAMGFASVVIGVGLDTGVHVYAAVLRAREARASATRAEIVVEALRDVGRPTLIAAIAAACAFGALSLSRLPALRQLGVLCAAGEVLTALAILAVTPWIAVTLEKKAIARPELAVAVKASSMAASKRGGVVVGAILVAAVMALAAIGPPTPAAALVAVKPRGLPSLEAQEEAIRLVSGDASGAVQLVVVQRGADREALFARGESLRNALVAAGSSRAVDALAAWIPSASTIDARLADRDHALAGRADALARALADAGFSPDRFASALDHLRHPASRDAALSARDRLLAGPLGALAARHLARDPSNGDFLLATYVRAPGLDAKALAADVAAVDPDAVVTGYPVLESSLRAALARDLPRVAVVALVLVALALRTVLRRAREVAVALVALAAELLLVALVVRVAHVPVHVYDALVLPVLLGITVDESMFLLHAMREGSVGDALRREGRAIVATATTTAAGFGALLVCRFPGLRDLGAVGLVGTLAGLVASIVVVPAAARAFGVAAKSTEK